MEAGWGDAWEAGIDNAIAEARRCSAARGSDREITLASRAPRLHLNSARPI